MQNQFLLFVIVVCFLLLLSEKSYCLYTAKSPLRDYTNTFYLGNEHWRANAYSAGFTVSSL